MKFLKDETAARLPELKDRLRRIEGLGFKGFSWYNGKFVIQLDSYPPEHVERMLRATVDDFELGEEFEISVDS